MMKKTLLLLAVAALAACSTTKEPATVTGTVIDATMNGLMIQTAAGDTLNISTMDTGLPGVLIADSVEITYKDTMDYKLATAITTLRHSPYFFIQGAWNEPTPNNAQQMQGFTLNPDGSVAMINMATLVFKNWTMPTLDSLIMTGESVGNGQTIQIEESYKIAKIDENALVLTQNGAEIFKLAKQK